MYKLIAIIVAAMPVILFLRTVFMGSKKRSQAVSNFKKQVDYVVWAVIAIMGFAVIWWVVMLVWN